MDFVEFCISNKGRLLKSLSEIAACIPKEMYEDDNKFDISKFFCHELERDFSEALVTKNYREHDMLYLDNFRISLKCSKTNIFQRAKMCGNGGTKPKSIILKNFRHVDNNRKVELCHLDYLWAIQYKKVPADLFCAGGIVVAYGVATVDVVKANLVTESIKDHQLKIKLRNDAWNYFSGYEFEELKIDDAENSRRYKAAEEYRWDLLRGKIKEKENKYGKILRSRSVSI